MFKRILVFSVLALTFFGCMEKDLTIKIKYDKVHGLQEGAGVFFEENHVGKVTGVSYNNDGSYVVDVAIKRDFVSAATDKSAFVIITDPREESKKAIEMIRAKEEGRPLQSGATVTGTNRPTLFLGKVKKKWDSMVDGLKDQFEGFTDKLREIPEREEIKKLEKEIQDLADKLKKAEKAVRDKIREEILPRLKEELNNLKERLRELGREKEVEPLEAQLEEIRSI